MDSATSTGFTGWADWADLTGDAVMLGSMHALGWGRRVGMGAALGWWVVQC